MPLANGSRLGPYEILSPLGAGGMGEVYRARDTKLGRDVAIKVLPEAFARDADRMARFQREAKVLASLNHPNIASIYGLEDSSGTRALVMELVEGPTLADRIRCSPIPVEEALRIAKQICEALEYAHERGIVHRDLKPANIKVTADENVKVLDFGLAKALDANAAPLENADFSGQLRRMENLLESSPVPSDLANSPTLSEMMTRPGILLGTAAYMSPEQAKAKPVDRRADIWAFGCVLYEMLTGKMAFRGETVTDTLAAVLKNEPDWSQLPAATPMRVRVLLQRCLQKDPKQRLQAIGDARIAIDEVLTGAPEPSAAATAPLWRRTLPWALFGAAALAFAVLAWVYQRAVSTAIPAEPVRLQITLPVKPTLRPTGLFALSPDGRQFAFAATSADGIPRIWIRAMNSLEMKPLPGTEAVSSLLIWSPDSRFIAFDAGGKLQKIDISGGAAETLCALNLVGVGGSWNKDGEIIFGQFGGTIMHVSASGGVATPLTVLDTSHGDVAHTDPSFLPDGRHFLYYRDAGTTGFVSVGSLGVKPEEQDSRRLVEAGSAGGYAPSSDSDSGELLFLRGTTLMAQPFDARRLNLSGEAVRVVEEPLGLFLDAGLFSVSVNGTLAYWSHGNVDGQFTWLDAQGKVLNTVGEPGPYAGVALSPDEARAFVTKRGALFLHALWLVDLLRGTSARFDLDPSADNGGAVWAPDGRGVIFSSAQLGQMSGIYEKSLSGAEAPEALLESHDWKIPLSWSPDGRFLMYETVGGGTKGDLWVLPLGDHHKPEPFLRTEFDERDGRFSPDGHWVAYTSDESGRDEVYVRSFSLNASGEVISDAGEKFLISSSGGSFPYWRNDGREMYYVDLDGKLMAVSLTTSSSFQAGVPRFLFQVPPSLGWEPSADGKRFLFLVTETQAAAPFTVVLNWQSALKK